MLRPRFDKAFECLVSVIMSEFVVRHKVDAQRFSLYAKTHTHACTHMHTEFALSSNANAHLLDRCVSKSMPRSVSADPNSGKFFAPARTCSVRCSKMEENGRKWKLDAQLYWLMMYVKSPPEPLFGDFGDYHNIAQ